VIRRNVARHERATLRAVRVGEGECDVKTYMCLICGFIYDEAKGRPEEGIPPGTKWADIPLSWRCPDCGSGKEDFEMVEV
jgi:rubredoxin